MKQKHPTPSDIIQQQIEKLYQQMEDIFNSGHYPVVEIKRAWSMHNPVLCGEFSHPRAYRWYLNREFSKLLQMQAEITIKDSRPRTPLNDPRLLNSVDEDNWDFTRKKLFLFPPERIDLSIDRLEHYTGTSPENFQRFILFTNYQMHVEIFLQLFPNCCQPERKGVQMPAYHHILEENRGITLINIGVGPSNAKTCTDHIAVLRPDAMFMVGHCGGLRNQQEIGDFVLASAYMRDDGVLDEVVPVYIPIASDTILNHFLMNALDQKKLNYRLGMVFTTDNRNWEFLLGRTKDKIHKSRSIAIDMESATIATNGFRYRIPSATLLSVSDKPLHGKPKLKKASQLFYQQSKEMHLKIVIEAIEQIKQTYPVSLPNSNIRSSDEPLMGTY
jgi:AMP nucleosidase